MPLPPPTISAILVTWNRSELLLATIDSLVRQEYPYLEIVVVDNASTDDTEAALARLPFPVRYLKNDSNLGACVARNQGVRVSGGELLLFMDSDAELLTDGALLSLAGRLTEDSNLAGVSGLIYSDREMSKLWCWSPCMDPEGFHDPEASVSPKEEVTVLSTCFSLFRRDIFYRVGGFDPFYFYLYEDADLSARIYAMGKRFFVDPDIGILHHYDERGRTERDPVQYHRYHERLRLYYLLKIRGFREWSRSVARFLRYPDKTRTRFPYLSWGRLLEAYAWRPFLQLLALPMLNRRRNRDWIAECVTPSRTDVLGGVSHEP
ncbi:MAG: glycosyltransferase family 2 protein [bacterium]